MKILFLVILWVLALFITFAIHPVFGGIYLLMTIAGLAVFAITRPATRK
jgi:hypothetical protein